jgi:hypothetical protein
MHITPDLQEAPQMRHIGSIVLSIIFAPVIYILTGVGMVKFGSNTGAVLAGQSTDWTAVGIGTGALVVAGALWAVLTMVRISPLGPLLAGLMFIGMQVWALLDLTDLISTLGSSVMGVSHAAEEPLNGPALVMAISMLATIFSPRRWRSKEQATMAASAYPTTYNAGPSYPVPTSAAPTYPTADGPTFVPPTYVPTPEATAPLQTTPENAGDTQVLSSEDKPTDEV